MLGTASGQSKRIMCGMFLCVQFSHLYVSYEIICGKTQEKYVKKMSISLRKIVLQKEKIIHVNIKAGTWNPPRAVIQSGFLTYLLRDRSHLL